MKRLRIPADIIPMKQDDEVLGVVGDRPPLLDCKTVDATCVDVIEIQFRGFGKRLVFDFRVFEPEEYAGTKLQMFVRLNPTWKTPPVSSRLWKAAQIASEGQLGKKQKIRKSLFVAKAFRCSVRTTGE